MTKEGRFIVKGQGSYLEFHSFGRASGFVHVALCMLLKLCLVFLIMVKHFFFYPSLEFQGWYFLPLKCLF